MKGLKIWLTTLIEYDEVGNGKVVKSFSKVAKDSNVGAMGKKKAVKKSKITHDTKEEEMEW
jgi:hypothetical protein